MARSIEQRVAKADAMWDAYTITTVDSLNTGGTVWPSSQQNVMWSATPSTSSYTNAQVLVNQ